MESSDRWTTRIDGNTLVVEFPHGTGLRPVDGEALLDRWRTLTADRRIEAIVLIVRTSRPCSDAGRRALRESTQIAVARGIERFAVVGERSKRRRLKRTMDVEDVTVEAFNDPEAAVKWAGRRSIPDPTVESSPS